VSGVCRKHQQTTHGDHMLILPNHNTSHCVSCPHHTFQPTVKSFIVLCFMILMLSFSVFVATSPSAAPITLFCTIFNPPLPLHLCGSLCEWIFPFLKIFDLFLLFFCSALSINPGLLTLFSSALLGLFSSGLWELLFFSGLLGLFFSGLLGHFFLDFWNFSLLEPFLTWIFQSG
jgi:hypothetical protein